MSLKLTEATTEHLTKLAPYSRYMLDCAAKHALRLFADEVSPEHLLTTMMDDEECGAHHAVIYAFADPQTIGRESLALSPGILVVSSSHSLPFSPKGVEALFGARKLAIEFGSLQVTPAILTLGAFDKLEQGLKAKLVESKFDRDALAAHASSAETLGASKIDSEAALFACYSEASRRVLGLSCKVAKQNQRDSISPAHLLGASAQREGHLADHGGLGAMQLSSLIGGNDADETALEPRPLPLDRELAGFIAELPSEADGLSTVQLLDGFCQHGTGEVRDILNRSRITAELLQKISKTYTDPLTAD